MYYQCSENKGADQLRGYREADLRLCFRIMHMQIVGFLISTLPTFPDPFMWTPSDMGSNHNFFALQVWAVGLLSLVQGSPGAYTVVRVPDTQHV